MTDVESLPALNSQDYIYNPAYGNEGGKSFEHTRPGTAYITAIDAWKKTSGGHSVFKSVRIHWSTGDSDTIGNNSGKPDDTVTFEGDETITDCKVYAGTWVDSISFRTNKGSKELGWSGGDAHKQDIGDGTLVGFHGKAGADVDRLGTVFQKKK